MSGELQALIELARYAGLPGANRVRVTFTPAGHSPWEVSVGGGEGESSARDYGDTYAEAVEALRLALLAEARRRRDALDAAITAHSAEVSS